ncbi:MAG: sensor histidine kinase [Microthrixaceae bacterium]
MDVVDESVGVPPDRFPWDVVVSGVVVLCVVAMTGLHLAAGNTGVDTGWPANLAMALGLGGVGSVLAHKVPRNPIGWLMVTAGLANGVMAVGREWAVFVTVRHPSLPGATLAAWFGSWPNIIALATLPLTLTLFPNGSLPSRRWRAVVWGLFGCMLMGVAEGMFTWGAFTEDLPTLTNPLGIRWSGLAVLGTIGRIGFVLTIAAALVSLAVKTRRADSVTRQQLRWVFFGASVLAAETVLEVLPWRGSDVFFVWTQPLALAVFLISIAVAVLRYRLWDLDLLIRMSLIYGVLIVLVTAVYVAVVGAFGQIADEQLQLGPSLIAAALGAAVFALLRDRVQRGVERIFYGDRGDPYRALSKLGERLDQPVPADSVLDEVVDAVAQSLRLGRVSLVVPGTGEVASVGDSDAPTSATALMFRDTQVGELIVAPRPGSRIRASEMRILSDLARPVAAVVHAVSVTDELQRSRRDLVTAREAERRKIRRNLHDGLGPALAAVRMKLDSAAMLLDTNPDAAKSVIDQLGADIRSTIADIRHLVYDLQPPKLDEIGLLESISEQARSFSGPLEDGQMLLVEMHAPRVVGELPAAVEVAAYRIVCEALANVARHSCATQCRVGVMLDEGLTITIDDDGVGMPENLSRGVGTLSMMERASELGGTLLIGPSPLGGTRVTACLPVVATPLLLATEELATSVLPGAFSE